MNKNEQDVKRNRLEKLMQATIINYEEKIKSNNNKDEDFDRYHEMLFHVFNGDFSEIFPSEYIEDSDDKEKIFKLASKYSSLCFYQGDFNSWLDSVEGVTSFDLDLISLKLLDNYDFLLRIANSGGEDALRELMKFYMCDAFEGHAVIEHLRNVFDNDNVLEHVIIEMTRKDGAYSKFTDQQKIALCSSPRGIIFEKEENKVYHKIAIMDTMSVMKEYILGDEVDKYTEEDFAKILSNMSLDDFEDVMYMIQSSSKGNNSSHK